ncbi:hypothetical protein KCP78_21010 [Salmonella enterica subsp. enterica]|nr:hypothetical protein KCP78_21010 [Salmonella enterica subsp. enterica]
MAGMACLAGVTPAETQLTPEEKLPCIWVHMPDSKHSARTNVLCLLLRP